MLSGKHVLLVMGGGIAAYKVLDLIRRLKDRGAAVRVVMTRNATEFVTPLSAAALSGQAVGVEMFGTGNEHAASHIVFAREADLVLVAPATANLIARMAAGMADDLATSCLIATTAPIFVCPAMNTYMWANAATQRNVARLVADGVRLIGPAAGEMAEPNETGTGRLVEPNDIVRRLEELTDEMAAPRPLAGRHIVVTSGPTHEPIDPVRYLANRSSGKQGHAIAAAAAAAGARVTLVSGPVTIPDPAGVTVVHVETAREMLAAVEAALPADAAIMAAAVADWRADHAAEGKIKKGPDGAPRLTLVENPDILKTVAHGPRRPGQVIGFAAETNDLLANASRKLAAKGADVIVANDVSPEAGVMGGDANTVHLVTDTGVEDWPTLTKAEVAKRLMAVVAARLERFPS